MCSANFLVIKKQQGIFVLGIIYLLLSLEGRGLASLPSAAPMPRPTPGSPSSQTAQSRWKQLQGSHCFYFVNTPWARGMPLTLLTFPFQHIFGGLFFLELIIVILMLAHFLQTSHRFHPTLCRLSAPPLPGSRWPVSLLPGSTFWHCLAWARELVALPALLAPWDALLTLLLFPNATSSPPTSCFSRTPAAAQEGGHKGKKVLKSCLSKNIFVLPYSWLKVVLLDIEFWVGSDFP